MRSGCQSPEPGAHVLNTWAFRVELEFRNVGFCGEGKTGVPGEKPLGAEKRTNNKLNRHMTSRPQIEPGLHWWKASAFTTAPSLLPWDWAPGLIKYTYIYIFLSFMYVIEYKANKGIIGWIHVVFQSNHSGLFRWSLLFVSTKKFYRSLQITYRQTRCKQYYLVRLTPVLPSLGIPIMPCQVAADVWPFVLKKRQNPIRNPHALNVLLNVSSSTRFSTALFFPSLITTSSKQMPLVFLSPKAHI